MPYACDSDHQCIFDVEGQFPARATCEEECKFQCEHTTGKCVAQPYGRGFGSKGDCERAGCPLWKFACTPDRSNVERAATGTHDTRRAAMDACLLNYDCGARGCAEVATGMGRYSLDECREACPAPEPKYSCTQAGCLADDRGTMSKEHCENVACRWSCTDTVAGTCSITNGGEFNYQEREACTAACRARQHWKCERQGRGRCVPSTDPGDFADKDVCEHACAAPDTKRYKCGATGTCVEVDPDAFGDQSWAECAASCDSRKSTYRCNPASQACEKQLPGIPGHEENECIASCGGDKFMCDPYLGVPVPAKSGYSSVEECRKACSVNITCPTNPTFKPLPVPPEDAPWRWMPPSKFADPHTGDVSLGGRGIFGAAFNMASPTFDALDPTFPKQVFRPEARNLETCVVARESREDHVETTSSSDTTSSLSQLGVTVTGSGSGAISSPGTLFALTGTLGSKYTGVNMKSNDIQSGMIASTWRQGTMEMNEDPTKGCGRVDMLNPAYLEAIETLPYKPVRREDGHGSPLRWLTQRQLEAYWDFFTVWGTHVLTKMEIGAAMKDYTYTSGERKMTGEDLQLSACVSLEGADPSKPFESSGCVGRSKAEALDAYKKIHSHNRYTRGAAEDMAALIPGGTPPTPANLNCFRRLSMIPTDEYDGTNYEYTPIWAYLRGIFEGEDDSIRAAVATSTDAAHRDSLVEASARNLANQQRVRNMKAIFEGFMALPCGGGMRAGTAYPERSVPGVGVVERFQVKDYASDTDYQLGCWIKKDGCEADSQCTQNFGCFCTGPECLYASIDENGIYRTRQFNPPDNPKNWKHVGGRNHEANRYCALSGRKCMCNSVNPAARGTKFNAQAGFTSNASGTYVYPLVVV